MAGNRGTDGHLISITGGLVGTYIKLDGSNTPTTGAVTFGDIALMQTTVQLQFGTAAMYIVDDGTNLFMSNTTIAGNIYLATTQAGTAIYSQIAGANISIVNSSGLTLATTKSLILGAATRYITDDGTSLIIKSTNSTDRDSPEIQTTDAIVTTVDTVTLEDNHAYIVDAKVLAIESDGSDRNMYHLEGLFYCDGGNATQQGATTSITTIESEAGCDLVFDVTGNDVRVRWTGIVAETWNVTGKIEITEVD